MQDDTALLDAAETGLVDTVLLLLDRGVSAFTVDLSGYTALHKCSFMGFDFVAKVLVEREPRLIDACDLTHNTPLHVAAWSGHVATSIALLEAGANVSACDLAGNTPLHRAVLEGHQDVVKVLLQHGANVNAAGSEGSSPLHFAVFAPDFDAQLALARLLLSKGADKQLSNRHGLTPAVLARNVGRPRLAELLGGATPQLQHQPSQLSENSNSSENNNNGWERNGAAYIFHLVLNALQEDSLRSVLTTFHSSHARRFAKHAGGDYPIELATLHAQYAGLVSRHIERELSQRGLTWADAAAACESAAYEGRCSALRLRLLQQLVAIDDFEAFFSLMAAPDLPAAESTLPGAAEAATGYAAAVASVPGSALLSAGHSHDEERWLVEEVDENPAARDPLTATMPSSHAQHEMAAPSLAATMESQQPPQYNGSQTMIGLARTVEMRPPSMGASVVASAVPSCSATFTSDGGSSTCSSILHSVESRPTLLEGSLQLGDGRMIDGHWLRGKRIGLGSSGEVYLVRDEARMLEFAAKLVVPRDAEAAVRLEKEIELMRHLRHINIVHYIGDAFSSDKVDRYILLEYCSGGSVRQLLEKEYRHGLPFVYLASIGYQLLCGLHFLHEHLVIHRDIKGENVLFADAERTTIKIADFGSSHELVAGQTLTHDVATIRGSPYWMSPEHIQGARCGRKADVWSYACVLLEMLTGVPPWTYNESAPTASGQFAVFVLMSKIVESTGPPPMPPPESMPPELHEMLCDCFARDLERRPTTNELLLSPWILAEEERRVQHEESTRAHSLRV